ncbi:dTDP-4-dehydrorhamnose reductase [Paracoccus shanxieyensis]|uniref:dTDP-4-dehydrorhamnose reductase n=1 Tax=Paracoccus shanxieyensis TaxID=2675752 RepID=A0A6L6IS01_9RHOB|nr:dTDP-4-dehydrorhamnose reductase [Paracoccus shanxieyensis]MTH63265.1 dTDP-4-dehydrorhamnose reductase [Paracoccus shanxieyensis]MTH87179.1 dTDP-4-dehydrorhamnose reductase [Paracoccus shanxieyensis]
MSGLLVFGRTGQVATELARQAPDAVFLGRDQADLSDPAACAAAIRDAAPDAVINAAAYTAVDRAESEPDLARAVNTDAPVAMARACAELGIPFVQISTDYVFDGSGDRPWVESDATGPLGVYGATKLAAEQGIAAAGGTWAVLRTSWVFSAHGANFVKTMMRLGGQRDTLNVVADQHGGPTPAADIAAACLTMTAALRDGSAKGGVYHFAGAPDTTWAGFARQIMAQADLACQVGDIATSDYPTPAKRPGNSRLDCTAIARDFGISRPDWRAALTDVVTELQT